MITIPANLDVQRCLKASKRMFVMSAAVQPAKTAYTLLRQCQATQRFRRSVHLTSPNRLIIECIHGEIQRRQSGAQNTVPLSTTFKLSLLSSLQPLELLMTCTCVVRKMAASPRSTFSLLSVSLGVRLLVSGCIGILLGSLCWL